MNAYKLFSALLTYPSAEMQMVIDQEIFPQLAQDSEWQDRLATLLRYIADTDLITVQENYVATFDRNPNHSLHLFEHLHGENRDRGDAMVNLLQEYQQQGFEPQGYELPDYLPLFLEFLSLQEPEQATHLLNEAVHVIHYVAEKLREHQSIYASVFDLLISLATVEPQALTVAPVRDMDEALEMFGPTADGVEPLLTPKIDDIQIVKISPRRPAAEHMGAK